MSYKILMITASMLLGLFLTESALAQQNTGWPPISVNAKVIPLEGQQYKIVIQVSNDAPWFISDVNVKIPLPANTRLVQISALPSTKAGFDGQEVSFLTNTVTPKGEITDNIFIVELTDPTKTLLALRPWASWKGQLPGDYLFDEITFDLTDPFLNWQKPYSVLQLYSRATALNGLITYYIYGENIGYGRIFDAAFKMGLPAQTEFMATTTPPNFEATFTGQEAVFLTPVIPPKAFVGPMILETKNQPGVAPFIYAHPEAYWTNEAVDLDEFGTKLPTHEAISGGTLIIEPALPQWVVADPVGDVPEKGYDLTSVALQRDGAALKITLYQAENLPLLGTGSRYRFYMDFDCSPTTGAKSYAWSKSLGMDYRLTYERTRGLARLHRYNPATDDWDEVSNVGSWADRQTVTMWLPYAYLTQTNAFCWVARAESPNFRFADAVPDYQGLEFTRYELNWDGGSVPVAGNNTAEGTDLDSPEPPTTSPVPPDALPITGG